MTENIAFVAARHGPLGAFIVRTLSVVHPGAAVGLGDETVSARPNEAFAAIGGPQTATKSFLMCARAGLNADISFGTSYATFSKISGARTLGVRLRSGRHDADE